MPRSSLFRAALFALAIACGAPAAPGAAAVLIEGEIDGQTVRIVADAARARALVRVGGIERLIDLDSNQAYRVESGGPARQVEGVPPAAGERPALYRLDRWSHGARVAGHRSHYHVLRVDGRICAEVLVGRWSPAAVASAVQALDLVERLHAGLRRPAGEGCGVIPFRAFAQAGWPLMAGLRDRTAFETHVIRFDYQPEGRERTVIDHGRTRASLD